MAVRRRVWLSGVAGNLARSVGARDPIRAARRLAQLARGWGQADRSIDIESLALARGIRRVERRRLRYDALLEETVEGFVAFINSEVPVTRQRFSLAHELGHVEIFQATKLRDAMGRCARDELPVAEAREIEQLCDAFAIEVLMPLEACQRFLFDEGVSLAVIDRLARRYEVSFEAACRRVAEADIWRCATILWAHMEKESQLTPLQVWSNMEISRHLVAPLLMDGSCSSAGSPVRALVTRERVRGPVTVVVDGEKRSYFGESMLFRGNTGQVLTLLVAEKGPESIVNRSEGRPRNSVKGGQ